MAHPGVGLPTSLACSNDWEQSMEKDDFNTRWTTSSLQHLAVTCLRTRAIDRSSRAGYRSIFVLTSLANTRTGQSECRVLPEPILSGHHAQAAKGEFYSQSRVKRQDTNALLNF